MLAPERTVGGRYQVLRLIGRGGMGEVWAATRLAIGDVVALKRLLPGQDTSNNRRRFAVEAQAAAHIRHPNVVNIFDYGEDEEHGPYLVMEMLAGHTLGDEVAAAPLDVDRALWAFSGICAAIEAGHRRGIVHRDLKPGNVFVCELDDGGEQVKVLDFGIAVDLGRAERHITTPGTVIGTAAYLAPELVEGRPATPASDVFALGVMLYEMVTGERPFRGSTPIEVMLAISGGRFRRAGDLVRDLPVTIGAAIDAALGRDPDRRPPSPEALARLATGDRTVVSSGTTPRQATAKVARTAADGTAGTVDTGDAAPMFARFVGREHELGRLREEYAGALAGRGRLVLVTGEAGGGKSRLLERFGVWAAEQGAVVTSARFVDPDAAPPPPLGTFAQLAGAVPDAAWDDRWRAFAAIADGLALQAAGRPLVVVLDDVQWATRLDLDAIGHLHNALGARGTLLALAARGPERPVAGRDDLARWRAGRAAAITEIALAPFDDDDVRAWLAGVFREIDVRPGELRRLLRATGGNPYALGELLRHLVARGEIARGEHGWRLDPAADLALPDGVAQLWRVRLAELDPAHRGVLEIAAVLGDELRFDVLAAAAGVDEAALDAAIDAAFARRLLTDRGVAAGHDARFTSAPVRHVLVADLAPRARRRAHQAAITALRGVAGDDRSAHALVHHLHAIGDWAGTVHAGVRASAAARARFDVDAATTALARADEAAARGAADGTPPAPDDLAALDREGGALALAEGALDHAILRLRRAAAAAATLGDAALHADALTDLARAHLAHGDHQDAARTAASATGVADAAGDRPRAVAARAVGAEIAVRRGAGLPFLDDVIADLRDGDPAALRSRVHRARAWARLKTGDWSGAGDDARRALDLARAAGDLAAHQLALAALSAIRNESGDPASAVDGARESLALARRLGDRRREGISMANLADTLLGSGDAGEAHELLRGALAIFSAIGDEACEGDCRVNLGRALIALGKRGDAGAVLERGIALCAATGRREFEGVGHLYLGDAQLDDDPARALVAYRRAAAILAAMDSHQRWRAELGVARASRALGDHAATSLAAAAAREHLEALRARLAPGQDAAPFRRALDEAARLSDPDPTEISASTTPTRQS